MPFVLLRDKDNLLITGGSGKKKRMQEFTAIEQVGTEL